MLPLLLCLLLLIGAPAPGQASQVMHHGAVPVAVLVDARLTTLPLAGFLYASPKGTTPSTAGQALALYRAGEFEYLPANLGRGYRQEHVWLAFDIDAQPDAPRLLIVDVGPAFLDEVHAYQADDAGRVTPLGRAGDQVPPEEVRVQGLRAAFSVRPDEGRTLLLEIRTTSTQAAIVKLHAAARYPALQSAEGLVFGAAAAISLVMAVGALALYLLFRDRAYLVWMLFVLLTCAQFLAFNGVVYLYTDWAELAHLNLATNVVSVLLFAVGGLLMTMLFQFHQLHPWLHRLFVGWVVMMVLPLMAVPIWGAPVVGILGLLGFPLIVIGIGAIGLQIARGHATSRLYGPMHIVYLLASLLNIAAILGHWPFSEITLYGWQLTTLLNLLSLQVSMFMRMRQQLLEIEAQRSRFVQALNSKNSELEHQVSERTASLAQALRDVQQAESEQRQLLSMASHEFRTPAAMIKSSLDSLRLLSSHIPAEVARRIENIEHATSRMIDLSNKLIHQDRVRELALHPKLAVVDLHALMAEVVARYRHAAPEAAVPNVLIDTPGSAPQPLTLAADPALISIALHNLIDNALQHGQAARGTQAGSAPIRVSLAGAADHVELRVTDAGPGIPDSDKTRIFERFHRLAKTGTDDRTGAARTYGDGLGLSIVRAIALAHGGAACAADNPGGGAVLMLRLPRPQAAPLCGEREIKHARQG